MNENNDPYDLDSNNNLQEINTNINQNNINNENNENNENNQEIQTNQNPQINVSQNHTRNVIINQINNINSNDQLINQNQNNGPVSEKYEISYEKNELVMLMAGSKSLAKNNKEKTKPNQYNLFDIDDPELFDGKIKCIRLKCILFGIITFFLNTIRLFYLIFLHLGYPAILWGVRFAIALSCFLCICSRKDEEIIVEPESRRERIDYPNSNKEKACLLCKNCGIAFYKFLINFVKCPCWFYSFVIDCFYDIKNRALDNARTGCYKFIHYDCGIYEKIIEDPFNNYMKKRHIILTTDPDDDSVIYGDACKDNTLI